MKFRKMVFHPFLVGVYPAVALMSVNMGEVALTRVVRPLLFLLLFAALGLGVGFVMTRNWHKAGLLTSFFIILFFSYGPLYIWLDGVMPDWFTRYQRFLLPALWLLTLLGGTWLLWRWLSRPEDLTHIFNVMVLVILAAPLYRIGVYVARAETETAVSAATIVNDVQVSRDPIPLSSEEVPQPLPDIYYILLDAYGRSDTLKELYGVDNSEFIDFLDENDFYVADRSVGNYTRTLFALSTSLNGEYLDDVAAQIGPDSPETMPLEKMVQRNRFVQSLKELGYRVISISSGYERTVQANPDAYYRYDANGLEEFENRLLLTTPLGPLVNRKTGILSIYDMKRARIHYAFEKLVEMPEQPGPKFVFAHIMAPHPPYVFGPSGEPLNLPGDPLLHEDLPLDVYTPAYAGQVAYVSQLAQQALTEILAKSETPPIIIIHGDHGPWFRFRSTPEETCLKERYTIFNAYYFPDGRYDLLYEEISPVNSFRVLFDTYFGTSLGVLPDKTFYSTWPGLYDFVDVTGSVETCNWVPGEDNQPEE